MTCFGSNNCSAPAPTPTPTPTPDPDSWDAPGNIQLVITDGFLLLLVLLTIGAFIYCCYTNKKNQEESARQEAAQQDYKVADVREVHDDQRSVETNTRFNLNQTAISEKSSSAKSLTANQTENNSEEGFDEDKDNGFGKNSGGFNKVRWHDEGAKNDQ